VLDDQRPSNTPGNLSAFLERRWPEMHRVLVEIGALEEWT
jgi:hypothetical protein